MGKVLKKIILKIEGKRLESFMGKLAREKYLAECPHGFKRKNAIFKNKKKYTRSSPKAYRDNI